MRCKTLTGVSRCVFHQQSPQAGHLSRHPLNFQLATPIPGLFNYCPAWMQRRPKFQPPLRFKQQFLLLLFNGTSRVAAAHSLIHKHCVNQERPSLPMAAPTTNHACLPGRLVRLLVTLGCLLSTAIALSPAAIVEIIQPTSVQTASTGALSTSTFSVYA